MIDLPLLDDNTLDSKNWYVSTDNTKGLIQAATVLFNTFIGEYYFNRRLGIMAINTSKTKRVYTKETLRPLLSGLFDSTDLFELESYTFEVVNETLYLDVYFKAIATQQGFKAEASSTGEKHVNKQPGYKFFLNRINSWRLSP